MKKNIKITLPIIVIIGIAVFYFNKPINDIRKQQATVNLASIIPLRVKPNTTTDDLPPQRVHPVRISGDVFFAGEKVPLNDQDIRERFDRELMVNTFWHSNTLFNYKLANKYFETIEAILIKEGIPLEFKYLAVAESGLRNIKSPAGASGIWQIMKATGKSYGLKVNDEVDERYHLEKATKVACDYLKEAKEKFGSWTLAAASYNVGMSKLQTRLNEQKVDNYYDLFLNSETSRYIFRILAYKMVFENPNKFGFFLEEEDLYEPLEYEIMNLEGSVDNLAQFAKDQNTTYKMLKLANPWLIDKKLTVKEGEVYEIKIPKNYIN